MSTITHPYPYIGTPVSQKSNWKGRGSREKDVKFKSYKPKRNPPSDNFLCVYLLSGCRPVSRISRFADILPDRLPYV